MLQSSSLRSPLLSSPTLGQYAAVETPVRACGMARVGRDQGRAPGHPSVNLAWEQVGQGQAQQGFEQPPGWRATALGSQ